MNNPITGLLLIRLTPPDKENRLYVNLGLVSRQGWTSPLRSGEERAFQVPGLGAREASFRKEKSMKLRKPGILSVVAGVVIALVLAAAPARSADVTPFEVAKIIFEFNSTDLDLGVQVSLNGDPWREIKIVSPDGRKIFEVKVGGSLKKFGFTELFSESNEPPFEEVPPEDTLAQFPAGVYTFFGKGVEGDKLVGTATLTHAVPSGPEIVSPAEGAVVNPNNPVMIVWAPVAGPPEGFPDEEIEIVGFQVIVERKDPARAFDVKLPAGATFVTIPPEFLEPGTRYAFEVLAIEKGGNQTITSSFFCTSPLSPCVEP
jgi:hypothetical protein